MSKPKAAVRSPDPERTQVWRERLARHKDSNQTVVAFCRAESVSVPTFYKWRNLLVGTASTTQRKPVARSPFVEVGTVPFVSAPSTAPLHQASRQNIPTGIDVRLDLGGGVVLHIVRS